MPLKLMTSQALPQSQAWDSFNSYVLLDELETEFKTQFTIEEVVETKNISDIKKHLKNHGIELND